MAVIAANSAGNILLRVGLSQSPPIVSSSPLAYLKAFTNAWVIAGVVILIAWLLLQLSLLSWADLTYVLPVTAATYVVIAITAAVALGERISPVHWLGIILILVGVVVVGRTKPLTSRMARSE